MNAGVYTLYGIDPSPYSVKMRAILRYRRLPFVWNCSTPAREVAIGAGLPPVIPVLRFPDGRLMNDSTPLADALEREHPGARSIVPDDPGLAYLSDLLEDFADEWLTKLMFHYRWYYPDDRVFAQLWVTSCRNPTMPQAERRDLMREFDARQVGRMALVGCTEQNRPIIEDSYRFVLDTLDRHGRQTPFLFGGRPSLADFAFYGQLRILATDPTPMAEMRRRAPDVYFWVMRLDDASGVDGAWFDPATALPDGIHALLRHCGDTYLPFLAANARAVELAAAMVDLEILGRPYSQVPFRYQAKCYDALRKKFAALPPTARERIEPLLRDTGCLGHLI
ncbi:MAG TPA: glutathione S-transferase family protein [Vineibacter sp.]|nr:glutathione S-transferase family protein [Vineibacter sp.]